MILRSFLQVKNEGALPLFVDVFQVVFPHHLDLLLFFWHFFIIDISAMTYFKYAFLVWIFLPGAKMKNCNGTNQRAPPCPTCFARLGRFERRLSTNQKKDVARRREKSSKVKMNFNLVPNQNSLVLPRCHILSSSSRSILEQD